MFKYLNRRIVILAMLITVLALLIFSRTTELLSHETAAEDVDIILPPYIDGAVTRRAYDDLPDIDIDSWEYMLVNQAHNCGVYAPDVEQIEGTSSYFEIRAIDKLYALLDAAKEAGFDPHVYVGYRAYVIQADQYRAQVAKLMEKGYSQADAEREAAANFIGWRRCPPSPAPASIRRGFASTLSTATPSRLRTFRWIPPLRHG